MASDSSLANIDTSVAHSARVYDYWLGGKDHFAADRALGDAMIAAIPTLPIMARANRAFLARAVRYLAAEAGVRQFLDIGPGLPTAGSTHEVAQEIAPEARVLYVDHDPLVLAHARALMNGSAQGQTEFIMADLQQPEKILADPGAAAHARPQPARRTDPGRDPDVLPRLGRPAGHGQDVARRPAVR
jgi:S-adenosyl methyltransferase